MCRRYRQVRTIARRFEIAVVGRYASSRRAVDRQRRNAGRVGRVQVGVPRVTEVEAGVQQRLIDLAPLRDRRPVDCDRAAVAVVEGVAVVEVVLQLVHRRQQLFARPARAALLGPAVVVVQHPAMGHLPVDRRAAAHPAPTVVEPWLLRRRSADQQRRPLVGRKRLRIHDAERVRAVHLDRSISGSIIRPGFEQQYRRPRILGQPRRENSAGRTRADDEVVKLPIDHRAHPAHLSSTGGATRATPQPPEPGTLRANRT